MKDDTDISEADPAVIALAERAVALIRERHQLNLDYTDRGVELLGAVIDALRERHAVAPVPTDELDALTGAFGAYLGEVLRRRHDWTWLPPEVIDGIALPRQIRQPPGLFSECTLSPAAYVRSHVEGTAGPAFWESFGCLADLYPSAADAPDEATVDRDELRRMLEAADDPNRRFPVRSCKWYGFYAGALPGGGQALITDVRRDACRLQEFDADGGLVSVREIPLDLVRAPEETYLPVNDEELHDQLGRSIGFVPEMIRVKRFDHPDADVVLDPLPSHLREFADDPEPFTAAERHEFLRSLRSWVSAGEFVLNYGNDYWMDARGDVTSS